MTMRLVSVTETDRLVISRYENGQGGAMTFYREKETAPEIALPSSLGRMHEIGSLEVARLEADAATDNDAEEITTAWDQQCGKQE